MKTFIIIFSCFIGIAFAKPGVHLLSATPLALKIQQGAPIGLDGQVVDTPEVAIAKAEHAAAHLNEKLNHAGVLTINPTKLESLGGAPIGLDGRVVDTPEVTLAKAEHAVAHLNEQLNTVAADSNLVGYSFAKLQSSVPFSFNGQHSYVPTYSYVASAPIVYI